METYDKALRRHRGLDVEPAVQKTIRMVRPKRKRPATKYSAMYNRLRKRAQRKGFKMELTETWLRERFESTKYCEVTGIPFEGPARGPFSPSLDRIDNSLGYTPENVQLVCWMYNAAKGPFTHEDVMRLANSLTGP